MKCHICGEDAESICLTCNSYYCESCFKFVHEKKKNVGHKKEIIDLYIPIMTKCPVHTDVPLNLFCLNDKELCCSMCQCLKPHEGHKHIPINEEESLKKENLTLDSTSNEFDKNKKQILDLTKEIEKELTKIDNSYENTNKQVINFFDEKRKKLKEEENDLIDKLKKEVTQTREKLELFLTDCNEIIKAGEKIYKGIEKFKKENENDFRKLLSYISAVNKNQKKIDSLMNQTLTNINIHFDANQAIIKYDKYNLNKSMEIYFSKILNENDITLLKSWLPNKPSNINLLFDTQRDGDSSSTFHDKCDGKSPTLVVIKSKNGYVFGGYATSPWQANNDNPISAPNSFIFSLNQKQKYYASSQQNSIINGGNRSNQRDSMMFRIGCCDINIKHNCTNNGQNQTNCDKFSVPSQNVLNGGNRYFTVSNLEVYEIKY